MSVKAMAYVWDTPYKGAKKLMLLAIADRCDDEGTCFPGVSKLAAKCSIKMRAAQALITELEKNSELVVQVQSGIETSHGKTNRYYMSGYRASIGLKTPTVGTRIQQITPKDHRMQNSASHLDGVQNSASQGMQDLTSQGMQNSASNTSEDTKGDTSESTFAPLAQPTDLPLQGNPDGSIRWPDSDEVSVIRLEKEENSTQENIPTKRTTKTKDSTPIPPTPLSAAPKQDNPLQSAVKALGQAYGVMPVEGDYGAYAGVASKLLKAGIVREEFAQYVEYWRNEAQHIGWKFTVTSLTGAGRMSEFVGWRDANARRIAALPPEIQRALKPVPVEDRVDPAVIDAFFKDIGISREIWAATAEKGMQK